MLADLLSVATTATVAALSPHLDQDWGAVMAADLTWTCSETTVHLLDDLYFYALQVIRAEPDGYLNTEIALDPEATTSNLLAAIPAHGELLRRAVVLAKPTDRAYHVFGTSDPCGFAAMGLVEISVHTYDLVRGLDPSSAWKPPAEVAAPVLERLFPAAPAGAPADVLLYCCGRAGLDERPRRHQWQWDGTVAVDSKP